MVRTSPLARTHAGTSSNPVRHSGTSRRVPSQGKLFNPAPSTRPSSHRVPVCAGMTAKIGLCEVPIGCFPMRSHDSAPAHISPRQLRRWRTALPVDGRCHLKTSPQKPARKHCHILTVPAFLPTKGTKNPINGLRSQVLSASKSIQFAVIFVRRI